MLARMSPLAVRCVGLLALGWGTSACQGVIESPSEVSTRAPNDAKGGEARPGDGVGNGNLGACSSAFDASPSVLRRLTKLELQLTLQELFRLSTPPDVSGVPDDSDQEGFRTIAALENVSDQHLRAYLDLATELANALLADPARRAAVIGCELTAEGCLKSFAQSFGKLAYRRDLDATELDDLVTRATQAALDVEDRYRFVVEALLASPSFLFRVEVGDGGELAKLGPLELASRL